MNYAATMEVNAVDATIESAVALTASLQNVLLDTQKNVQEYVTSQQSLAGFRKLISGKLLKQYYQLHSIERKIEGSANKVKSQKHSVYFKTIDVAHELGLKLSVRDLLQDFVSLRVSYEEIHEMLRKFNVVSLLSFSIKRSLKRIFKSLNNSIDHAKLINSALSKVHNYSEQEYSACREERLAGIATESKEALKLSPSDIEFILDIVDEPKAQSPSPTMQKALEQYANIS